EVHALRLTCKCNEKTFNPSVKICSFEHHLFLIGTTIDEEFISANQQQNDFSMQFFDMVANQINVCKRGMTVETRIIYPGAIKTISDCIADQSGPGTIVGLCSRSGGTSANGDNAEPICEICWGIGAAKTQRVLVDVTNRCHARDSGVLHGRDAGILPNFIVIRTKHDFLTLY